MKLTLMIEKFFKNWNFIEFRTAHTYINIYYACINEIKNFVQMIHLERNST